MNFYNQYNNLDNKDNMWNVFDSNYEEIIKSDLINFRNNGLTCGIEIGLLQSDRNKILNNKYKIPIIYDEDYTKILIKRYNNLLKLIDDENFIN